MSRFGCPEARCAGTTVTTERPTGVGLWSSHEMPAATAIAANTAAIFTLDHDGARTGQNYVVREALREKALPQSSPLNHKRHRGGRFSAPPLCRLWFQNPISAAGIDRR